MSRVTGRSLQPRDYHEYVRLAEHVYLILRMCLGPLAEDMVKDINYNDPQRIYQTLEFEPDTVANRLDKLSKFLNSLQNTGVSTVQCCGRVRGLLRKWSELWPAAYSSSCSRRSSGCMLSFAVLRLASSASETAMPVQGTGMPPQWSGYLTPMTQWTLLQAPTQAAFATQVAPATCSTKHAASIASTLPPCSTVCGVKSMVTTSLRSAATCSAPRCSAKLTAPSPKPALARASHRQSSPQMPHLQSLLVKQVAICPLQTLSLINTGTQTQGPLAI